METKGYGNMTLQGLDTSSILIQVLQIIRESDKAHKLRAKLQQENRKIEGIMNDRQKAYDLKLVEMRKELEGAQLAGEHEVAGVKAKCEREIAKYEVSMQSFN